jgi:Skp family chaperone for outer membrane proteins
MEGKVRKIFLMGMVVFVCFLTFAHSEQGLDIVYIDFAKVFTEYRGTKSAELALEQKIMRKHEQREKMIGEIRRLKDEYALLAPEAQKEKQPLIEEKIRELQGFDQQFRLESEKARDDALRQIIKEIKDYVRIYAEKQGLCLVLNMSEAVEIVIYGKPELDRTADIIKGLNEKFDKREE